MTGKLKIKSIDDLTEAVAKAIGLEVLGFLTRPTVGPAPTGSGFVPYTEAVRLAALAGLPPEFCGNPRAEGDAYRLAWGHVETLAAFNGGGKKRGTNKRTGYIRRGYRLPAGHVIQGIWNGQDVVLEEGASVDCILKETAVKVDEQEIDTQTIQSALFVPSEKGTQTNINPRRALIVFKHPGPKDLFVTELLQYYDLYKNHVTTSDLMSWIVRAIKDICAGCMVSGTASIYFVPRLIDVTPYNEPFKQLREFGNLLAATGQVRCQFWTDAKWDMDEVRAEIAQPIVQDLSAQQAKVGASILGIIESMEQGKKVKSVTAPRQLAELRKLKQKAELYKEAFGIQVENLLTRFDATADDFSRHLTLLANGSEISAKDAREIKKQIEDGGTEEPASAAA